MTENLKNVASFICCVAMCTAEAQSYDRFLRTFGAGHWRAQAGRWQFVLDRPCCRSKINSRYCSTGGDYDVLPRTHWRPSHSCEAFDRGDHGPYRGDWRILCRHIALLETTLMTESAPGDIGGGPPQVTLLTESAPGLSDHLRWYRALPRAHNLLRMENPTWSFKA